MDKAKLKFLGTGTSLGVPIIGCKCNVCTSPDSKDKRFRSAALVDYQGLRILIDAGPDFRSQMLNAGVNHLDAILLTHNHKDHTGGLDDVRALNYIDRHATEIYCEHKVFKDLEKVYDYAFKYPKYPGAPEWHINLIENKPFLVHPCSEERQLEWVEGLGYCYKAKDGSNIPTGSDYIRHAEIVEDPLYEGNKAKNNDAEVIPIRGLHDKMPVLGFRFGNIAYITDMSSIPEEEFEKLHNLEHVTLNTVSYNKHHSHFSLDEALSLADKIGAEHTWLTHLSHTFPRHNEFCKYLKAVCKERNIHSIVQPAYDGLEI